MNPPNKPEYYTSAVKPADHGYDGYFGTLFAIKRYALYASITHFVKHSTYKGLVIERCYDGHQPRACYIASHAPARVLIIGDSLDGVKKAITEYLKKIHEVTE